MSENLTVAEVVAEGSELARKMYKAQGYEVREGYEFYNATHPQESGCWVPACIAYDHIEGTDLEECLHEWLEELEE